MTLASLVNIQKMSRRQKAQGYDAPSKMGASCQKLRKCQDQIKQGNIPSRSTKVKDQKMSTKVKVNAKAKVNRLTAPGNAKTLKASPV